MKEYLLLLLFVCTVCADITVEKLWNVTSPIVVDNQRNVTVNSITYTIIDFPSSSTILSVSVAVNFRKTGGNCAAPTNGNPYYNEIGLAINYTTEGLSSYLFLIFPNQLNGTTPMTSNIWMNFSDSGSPPLSYNTPPTAGVYKASNSLTFAAAFAGKSTIGVWDLVASDTAAQDQFCIYGFNVRVTGTDGVTTSPLTTSPVTSGDITTSPLTSGDITTSPLTSGDITTSSVTSGDITTSPVTSGDITTSPVTSGDITTSPVTSGDITTGDITTSPVTSGDITTSQFTSQDMTSGSLTSSQMTSGSVTTSQVTTGNINEGRNGSFYVVNTTGDYSEFVKEVFEAKMALILSIDSQRIEVKEYWRGSVMVRFIIYDEPGDPSQNYINLLNLLVFNNDSVLIENGIIVQEACSQAPVNGSCQFPVVKPTERLAADQLCPTDKPFKCPVGVCVSQIQECALYFIQCPPERPYQCSDFSCKRIPRDCLVNVTCQASQFRCWNGDCVNDRKFCGTLSGCSLSNPKRCSDGSCVPPTSTCPPDPDCISPRKRCPDGDMCVMTMEECAPYDGCPPDLPIYCQNGNCTKDIADCQCQGTRSWCFDGSCRTICPSPPSAVKPAAVSLTLDTSSSQSVSLDILTTSFSSQIGAIQIPNTAFNFSGVNTSVPFGIRVTPVADSDLKKLGGIGDSGRVLSCVIGVTLSSPVTQPFGENVTLIFKVSESFVTLLTSPGVCVGFHEQGSQTWTCLPGTLDITPGNDSTVTVRAVTSHFTNFGVLLETDLDPTDSDSNPFAFTNPSTGTTAIAVSVSLCLILVGVCIVVGYRWHEKRSITKIFTRASRATMNQTTYGTLESESKKTHVEIATANEEEMKQV